MADTFVNTRQLLDSVLGEQNERVTELQLNANHGLSESLSRFQESCRFVRAVLERNEDLAREAERLGVEGERLGAQQDALEVDVRKLGSHNREIASRVNGMRREQDRLQDETGILKDAHRSLQEDLSTAQSKVGHLKAKKEKAEKDVSELVREATSLEAHLAQLDQVREEYLKKVRDSKQAIADLTDGSQ